MTIWLSAIGLTKEWNGTVLFENVDIQLTAGERAALFGRNGVGKTTLLRGLLGRVPFDKGSVDRRLPLERWGSLEQRVELAEPLTALDYVRAVSSPALFAAGRELMRLQERMRRDGDDERLLERYGAAFDRYAAMDGYGWETAVEIAMRQLKLEPAHWGLPFGRLSGGQKTRAQLAAMTVSRPELIVLDEPTNHLDQETLRWLEDWIRGYRGTVLYVSHDREFIDRTATCLIELERGGSRTYPGGYTAYREQKEREMKERAAAHRKQELEREKLIESIRRYSLWFDQAHKAAGQNPFLKAKAKKNVSRLHAKESALERLERQRETAPQEAPKLKMKLESEAFEASVMIGAEGAAFAYPDAAPLFGGLSFSVNRGDRIAVLGPNGAGKTTLLGMLTGRLAPTEGRVQHHPRTTIGYFAQELEGLDEEATLLDSLLDLPGMTQTEARTLLGCFLFSRDDVFKRIGELSMGEKCRAAFLRLLFGRANLLVLDEPTNFLDVDTRERVEAALVEYPGALLIASHDRYLIRATANRLLVLDGRGGLEAYPGTYDEYHAEKRERPADAAERERLDERERLQLRLIGLVTAEEPTDEAARAELLAEIRSLRRQLEGSPG